MTINAINPINNRHAAIPPTMPPISAASTVGDACTPVAGKASDVSDGTAVDSINANADDPLSVVTLAVGIAPLAIVVVVALAFVSGRVVDRAVLVVIVSIVLVDIVGVVVDRDKVMSSLPDSIGGIVVCASSVTVFSVAESNDTSTPVDVVVVVFVVMRHPLRWSHRHMPTVALMQS